MTEMPVTAAGSSSDSKSEAVRRAADAALDALAEQLASGKSDQLTRYLAAMGRFHRYSFQNLMLILSQRPEATHVAGFHTWKSLGRSVRKGERGIAIIAPMIFKASEEVSDNGEKIAVRFRLVYVFDIEQTDGDPLPEPAKIGGDPGEATQRLEHAVRSRGITLDESEDLGAALGVSRGGSISLRPGLLPAERFATLVHEFAHELLHKDKGERPPKRVRETEAEAVAHVVCQTIGLDTGTAASDYIQLYRGDRETLATSLDRIQKTACEIIEAVSSDEQLSDQRAVRPVKVASARRRGKSR
jgi:antirestriction protein ArdC